MAKSDAGDEAAALSLYLEALALERERPNTLYNIGLIYKYRRDWEKSLRYNLMAARIRSDHDATNWNTAIAATALKDWSAAREAWRLAGIEVEGDEGPINGNYGMTPVRLNGFEENAAVEVVWARRKSPVTARILNIPTPAAKFRYGDVVLHDGAGTGTRLDGNGNECPVFNVFELFEPSEYITYEANIEAPSADDIEVLRVTFDAAQIAFEDWTASMSITCKACSEGQSHEKHEHAPESKEWRMTRHCGIAARDLSVVEDILERWCNEAPAREVELLEAE